MIGHFVSEGVLWVADLYAVVVRQAQELPPSPFDELPYSLSLVGGQVVHHHHLASAQSWREDPLHVRLEDLAPLAAPSTASEGPIPSMLMLESSVVFLPRLRGTEQ